MNPARPATEQCSAPRFALWHRRNRCDPWRVFVEGTEEQCGAVMTARGPSGDYCTLPAGQDPNDPMMKGWHT